MRLAPVAACLVALVATIAHAPAAELTPAEYFEQDIQPILVGRCLECHGESGQGKLDLRSRESALAGGENGRVIVPGSATESKLYEYVATEAMPPQDPLNAEQIAAIKQWIDDGAHLPAEPLDPLSTTTDRRAGYDWWSLQPLSSAIPEPHDDAPEHWRGSTIDRFVYRRLSERGLTPSPAAGPRTLIRRATYDLIGLPPTPAEVADFIEACRSETGVERQVGEHAYAALVDRLLSSPRYGEHWGRHWLDVVRFGESNGFERNIIHTTVWPFRDYVIGSLNDDKPFDQLIREHLAGDVIGPDDAAIAVGTAFLVCGPYDNVGNQDAAAAAQIRADTIDEMIRATGEAFLGLTVGCARCHDHKFDPISQRDYYGLYATLSGVRHGERTIGQAEGENQPPKWWVGTFVQDNGPFHVFTGGSPQRRGAEVTPASIKAFEPATPRYELAPGAPESQRRMALADWIVADDNPLAARVLANRLWHYHFGTGLVDTPSDFGFLGGRPSHPQLLDHLAIELRAHGWRLKPLHRQIMLSQTYRQASDHRTRAASIDGNSRLLWRYPPRRLTGEQIRDATLAVAGKLDTTMGGPGFRLFKYVQDNVATYYPLDQHGPETYRRAVYHHNARATQIDLMSEYDTPDCAFATPRRSRTTTPLQSLTMMNHSFTIDMAAALADRIASDTENGDIEAQIAHAFELLFSRSPNDDEVIDARQLIAAHGTRAFCRAMLNASEFIYID